MKTFTTSFNKRREIDYFKTSTLCNPKNAQEIHKNTGIYDTHSDEDFDDAEKRRKLDVEKMMARNVALKEEKSSGRAKFLRRKETSADFEYEVETPTLT